MAHKGAKLYRGHHSHAASATDPNEDRDFGKAPVVGQSRAYESGANAHGKHQKRKSEPEEDGSRVVPLGQPEHPRGWDDGTSR